MQAQWRIFTPALHTLQEQKVEPEQYAYGGRGPTGADDLARRYGMSKFGGNLTPYVRLEEKIREVEEPLTVASLDALMGDMP